MLNSCKQSVLYYYVLLNKLLYASFLISRPLLYTRNHYYCWRRVASVCLLLCVCMCVCVASQSHRGPHAERHARTRAIRIIFLSIFCSGPSNGALCAQSLCLAHTHTQSRPSHKSLKPRATRAHIGATVSRRVRGQWISAARTTRVKYVETAVVGVVVGGGRKG